MALVMTCTEAGGDGMVVVSWVRHVGLQATGQEGVLSQVKASKPLKLVKVR